MDMFSAVLAVCFIILLYRKCTVMRIIDYMQKGYCKLKAFTVSFNYVLIEHAVAY